MLITKTETKALNLPSVATYCNGRGALEKEVWQFKGMQPSTAYIAKLDGIVVAVTTSPEEIVQLLMNQWGLTDVYRSRRESIWR